ncbi:MAG: hypothetical protein FWE62_05960, partial [Firmicutes bacterium]|nr:hypothetical protein [Bacillota bacterium]
MDLSEFIEELIAYASEFLYLPEEDAVYTRNKLRALFAASDRNGKKDYPNVLSIEDCGAVQESAGVIEAVKESVGDAAAAVIMDCLSPPPARVTELFDAAYSEGGATEACAMLASYWVKSGALELVSVGENIKWT